MTPDGKYLADTGSAGFKEAEGLVGEGRYIDTSTGKETPAVVGGAYTVSSRASDGSVVTNAAFVWTGDSGSQFMSGWKLYPAGSVQTGADAGLSSSPAQQATSAPSPDEGGIIAGGQAMSVQAAQSHSPQGAGGGPSMGAVRSGLEAASWIPGPIGSVAAATLVGIDIYQGNYGQAALGALGIFGGRAMTSGVRAVRDTKIVTAALEGLSGAGAKLGNAFAGWAKGAARGGGETLSRLGTSKESANRLARKAAEAEGMIGIHGVSVTAGQARGPASQASRGAVESVFRVHNTPTRGDPLHRTVELPKPVTAEIADAFNSLFGRQ